MEYIYEQAIAFIVEGDTEKEFYLSLLSFLGNKHGAELTRQNSNEGTDISYLIKQGSKCVLVKFYGCDAISQVPKSGKWFNTQCVAKHKKEVSKWSVFLCYDTDNYKEDVTKFQEGDWSKLRATLKKAHTIVDLAAAADIEDVMLEDLSGICSFIGCNIPEKLVGRKGNVKLRNLFRDNNSCYHKGRRARPLIDALDMQKIIDSNIIPLLTLENIIFC